jgi:hypothetical protein
MRNNTHSSPQSKNPPAGETVGFAGVHEKQQRQCIETGGFPQEVFGTHKQDDERDPVGALEAAFSRIGGRLFALCDGSFLAVHGAAGLSQACPDRRAVSALLRALGA